MTRKTIPVEEAFAEWRKDPEYVAAYDALEEEFALASALIRARGEAHMTQEQVAEAMGTTQGCRRAPGEWTRHALDAHAPAVRQGDELPIEDHLRAGRTGIGRLQRPVHDLYLRFDAPCLPMRTDISSAGHAARWTHLAFLQAQSWIQTSPPR